MTRRRTSVNIYDYPEHLNPFREDVEEDKFSTLGRRRPSFRVNAWNLFSPNKGKSKTSEDHEPVSSSAASRFMTWTPKLLRKASFHRPSPHSSTHEPVSSQLAFRTSTLRSSLPPPSSRSSLSPSNTLTSRRTLSPPARPAPPAVRPPLSPNSTVQHTRSPSIANSHNAFTAASPPRKLSTTAGEQQSEDEGKYVQQGARPKKKRRAPPPPPLSSGNPTNDNRQVNSHESDTSLTSSVTSSGAEETLPQVVITGTQEGQEKPSVQQDRDTQIDDSTQNNKLDDKPKTIEPSSEFVRSNDPVTDNSTEAKEEVPVSSEQFTDKSHSRSNGSAVVIDSCEENLHETLELPKNENDVTNKNDEDCNMNNGTVENYEASENQGKSSKLHNGRHTPPREIALRNGMEKVKLASQVVPEPKPRTILPNMTKD